MKENEWKNKTPLEEECFRMNVILLLFIIKSCSNDCFPSLPTVPFFSSSKKTVLNF